MNILLENSCSTKFKYYLLFATKIKRRFLVNMRALRSGARPVHYDAVIPPIDCIVPPSHFTIIKIPFNLRPEELFSSFTKKSPILPELWHYNYCGFATIIPRAPTYFNERTRQQHQYSRIWGRNLFVSTSILQAVCK